MIKRISKELKFDFCGISKAEFLEKEAPRLENWLNHSHHGQMQYMEKHFDKRLDPRLLVPDAKSVITVLYNYYPEQKLDEGDDSIKLSKYAYGVDYHLVIKDKLKVFFENIQSQIGGVTGRFFVDSAPIMEKAWAQKSGLGWVGKHSNLLNREMGSFFFIAELIVDLELEPDGPMADYCGTCTKCIDACPTDAITPYWVDGSKCISYFTIELKSEIPVEMSGKFENWAFGCDICQDVCPWNRFSKPHQESQFLLTDELKVLQSADFQNITEEIFQTIFRKSPLKRTKYEGFLRNLKFLKTNAQKT
ncbi:MAG: tRNA epoxyqueuosine(34) reductase QueG [Bacteroidota bacterium]